ncbi:MAG: hypothetical protein GX601_15385 [Anaerolineales bacterium]|nr:hypothetical protein [Anaerolineales bacterium]
MKRVVASSLKRAEFCVRWALLGADERRLVVAWLRANPAERVWRTSSRARPVVIGA